MYTVFNKLSLHCKHSPLCFLIVKKIFCLEILTAKASQQPPVGAAVRWAINADGEGGLSLLLQALPTTAASLNSRPAFKRDICPGVALVNSNLSVDIDYNPGIIGPRPRLFSTAADTTDKVLRSSKSSCHNTAKGKRFHKNKYTVKKHKWFFKKKWPQIKNFNSNFNLNIRLIKKRRKKNPKYIHL